MKAVTQLRSYAVTHLRTYALTHLRNCATILLSLLCFSVVLSSSSHEKPEKLYCNIAKTVCAGIFGSHIAGYTASGLIVYEQRFPP